jgi:hypothetical protein
MQLFYAVLLASTNFKHDVSSKSFRFSILTNYAENISAGHYVALFSAIQTNLCVNYK